MPKPKIKKILREALLQPASLIIVFLTTAMMLFITVILMNYSFLQAILALDTFSFKAKLEIFLVSLTSFHTSLSLAEQIITLATAVLAGINAAMLVFLLRQRISIQKTAGISALGIIGSLLGLGCASCGSVLLVSFLGLASASGLIAVLPLHGMEFGLASIILLLFSLIIIINKLRSPLICK